MVSGTSDLRLELGISGSESDNSDSDEDSYIQRNLLLFVKHKPFSLSHLMHLVDA